jgi:hypothetical protein
MIDTSLERLVEKLEARLAEAKAQAKRTSPYDDNWGWNQRRGRVAGLEEALALTRELAAEDGANP